MGSYKGSMGHGSTILWCYMGKHKIIFSVVGTVIGGFFQTAWTVVKTIWDAVTGYFQAIFDTIKGIFSAVTAVFMEILAVRGKQ